jgi:hypothetical protein
MATELAGALGSEAPAHLSCTFTPANATGPVAERAAAVAEVVRREAGRPTVAPHGVVTVASAGWPEATWAVAQAERLQLAAVTLAGWRWSPEGGWVADPGAAGAPLTLRLAG